MLDCKQILTTFWRNGRAQTLRTTITVRRQQLSLTKIAVKQKGQVQMLR